MWSIKVKLIILFFKQTMNLVSTLLVLLWDWKYHLLLSYVAHHVLYRLITNVIFGKARNIPGPWHTRFTRAVSMYYGLWGEGIQYRFKLHQKYGDVVRLGPENVCLCSPEAFQVFLREMECPKAPVYHDFEESTENLTSFSLTDKQDHRMRRRIVSQAFSTRALKENEKIIFEDGVKKMAGYIDRRKDKPIDIGKMFNNATLDIIGKSAFGASFQLLDDELADAKVLPVQEAIRQQLTNATPFLLFPWFKNWTWFTLPKERAEWGRTLFDFACGLRDSRVAKAQEKEAMRHDILGYLVSAKDPETGQGLNDEQITAESITFLSAGSETTSYSLTWIIYLLLKHPNALQKVLEEIEQVSPLSNGEWINHETAKEKMPYLGAVINETLRICPLAGGGSTRVLDRDITFGPHVLEKGTITSLFIYGLHHHPQVWPDPESFKPERFLNLTQADLKNRFEPFSVGMRNCVGRELAKMEMRLFLANLLKFYSLTLVNKQEVKPVSRILYVPDQPIYVQVQKNIVKEE
jgi:cytochrome P450